MMTFLLYWIFYSLTRALLPFARFVREVEYPAEGVVRRMFSKYQQNMTIDGQQWICADQHSPSFIRSFAFTTIHSFERNAEMMFIHHSGTPNLSKPIKLNAKLVSTNNNDSRI